jgi:hypothetical protein
MPNSACPSKPLHNGHGSPGAKKSQGGDDHSPRHKKITEPHFGRSQEREKIHPSLRSFMSLPLKQAASLSTSSAARCVFFSAALGQVLIIG